MCFLQVSKQAKEFLEFVYEEPLLDVQQLNPCLYEHCEPLRTVLRLRQQLQSLRAYLFSCRATVAEDLRRRWGGGHVFPMITQTANISSYDVCMRISAIWFICMHSCVCICCCIYIKAVCIYKRARVGRGGDCLSEWGATLKALSVG